MRGDRSSVDSTGVSGNKALDLQSLLAATTVRERELKRMNDEIKELLSTPSVLEKARKRKFRSHGGSQVQLFCVHGTRNDCRQSTGRTDCSKLHFKKIIHAHTDGKSFTNNNNHDNSSRPKRERFVQGEVLVAGWDRAPFFLMP